MLNLLIFVICIVLIKLVYDYFDNRMFKGGHSLLFKYVKDVEYKYKRKSFVMSRAEHDCYDVLMSVVGDRYYVFPQVHLSTLFDGKIWHQSWRGAFSHINQKSVDFVLCDKAYISAVLAIELDDKTHERVDRVIRDDEVDRIFKETGLPLLRVKNNGQFNPGELLKEINTALSNGGNRI